MWNEANTQALRNFINENPGFKEEIRSRFAPITDTETIEARAMAGSERKGQESVLLILEEMQLMPLAPEPSPFIDDPNFQPVNQKA